MNNNRKCSERMRTILQAMERSIDAARRSRMKIPSAAEVPPSPPPPVAKPIQFNPTVNPGLNLAQPTEAPRLKARPKRLDGPMINPFPQSSYRSQAG